MKVTGFSGYTNAIHFGLIDANHKLTHGNFTCKDYFNEMIYSNYQGRVPPVFGPFDIKAESYRLALNNPQTPLAQYIENFTTFLNYWDDLMHVPRTTVEPTEDNSTIVLTINKEWFGQPIRLSLYLLLCRIGFFYTPDKTPMDYVKGYNIRLNNVNAYKFYNDMDRAYIKQAGARWDMIAKGEWPCPKNQWLDMKTYSVHSGYGWAHYVGDDGVDDRVSPEEREKLRLAEEERKKRIEAENKRYLERQHQATLNYQQKITGYTTNGYMITTTVTNNTGPHATMAKMYEDEYY